MRHYDIDPYLLIIPGSYRFSFTYNGRKVLVIGDSVRSFLSGYPANYLLITFFVDGKMVYGDQVAVYFPTTWGLRRYIKKVVGALIR